MKKLILMTTLLTLNICWASLDIGGKYNVDINCKDYCLQNVPYTTATKTFKFEKSYPKATVEDVLRFELYNKSDGPIYFLLLPAIGMSPSEKSVLKDLFHEFKTYFKSEKSRLKKIDKGNIYQLNRAEESQSLHMLKDGDKWGDKRITERGLIIGTDPDNISTFKLWNITWPFDPKSPATIYIKYENGRVEPRTGKWGGVRGSTHSGLSLSDNVKQKNIKLMN